MYYSSMALGFEHFSEAKSKTKTVSHLGGIGTATQLPLTDPATCCVLPKTTTSEANGRNDRRISRLPAKRNLELGLQFPLEQLLKQASLGTATVVRSGMPSSMPSPRNRVNGQPVAHLILDLFDGQIVRRISCLMTS
jgi:hypothetical protein